MTQSIHTIYVALACLLIASGCTTPLPRNVTEPVYAFKSDGCSVAPDFNFTQCCLEHDKAYWRGGTCAERRAADQALKRCITENGHGFMSNVYYASVRLFGGPVMPAPWRWGFGWPYGMGYVSADNCKEVHESAVIGQP
jgi:hypothetical protein